MIHTKGPWKSGIDGNLRVYGPDGSEGAGLVAQAFRRSDINLICASPDLLFAIEQIVGSLPSKRDWLDPNIERFARAAIKKARGE